MKMSKNIVLLSIVIVTIISLVAIATYSYFTASVNTNNKITTNVKMPLRPTFTVSGGGEMALTIDHNLTLKENSYNGTWISNKNFQRAEKGLTVTLTGEPGTTCTYNIYYKDTSSDSTMLNISDFSLNLSKNGTPLFNNAFGYFRQTSAGVAKETAFFGGSASPFNQVKPVIIIPTGNTSTTDVWLLSMDFNNREWDQSYLADKTFKGELYVGDVSCT